MSIFLRICAISRVSAYDARDPSIKAFASDPDPLRISGSWREIFRNYDPRSMASPTADLQMKSYICVTLLCTLAAFIATSALCAESDNTFVPNGYRDAGLGAYAQALDEFLAAHTDETRVPVHGVSFIAQYRVSESMSSDVPFDTYVIGEFSMADIHANNGKLFSLNTTRHNGSFVGTLTLGDSRNPKDRRLLIDGNLRVETYPSSDPLNDMLTVKTGNPEGIDISTTLYPFRPHLLLQQHANDRDVAIWVVWR